METSKTFIFSILFVLNQYKMYRVLNGIYSFYIQINPIPGFILNNLLMYLNFKHNLSMHNRHFLLVETINLK